MAGFVWIAMSAFVLLPGAGPDSWYWHLVIAGLEAHGRRAIAVDLPFNDESVGWHDHADWIVDRNHRSMPIGPARM